MKEQKPKKIYKFKVINPNAGSPKIRKRAETIEECKNYIHSRIISIMRDSYEDNLNDPGHFNFEVEMKKDEDEILYILHGQKYSTSGNHGNKKPIYKLKILPTKWHVIYE